jgi:hypothetical protein
MIAASALGAVALVAATVAIVLLLNSKSTASYASQARVILKPVAIENEKLSQAIQGLTAGHSIAGVRAALVSTETEVQAAQQELAALDPSSDSTLSSQVDAAIAAELQWIRDASTTLRNPASPLTSQLSALGQDAQSRLDALGTSIPSLLKSAFPSASNKLATYASAITTNAHQKTLEIGFSGQVLALLNQSTSTFQLVNSFYAQLQAAANGTGATFTISQAEQQINSIISSRTSLEAAAQALSAPTTNAQSVITLLVASFTASLKDDNDLASCLNQANYGTVAYIYQSCLSSSSGDNAAATGAKQAFLSAYNQMRATIGEPSVSPQF